MTAQPNEDETLNEQNHSIKHAKKNMNTDLPDNEHDIARMQPEEVILDLPDVSEIPGQEHIHVPRIKEMQDVTIASDDEEGVGIFGDDEDEEEDIDEPLELTGSDGDVSRMEQGLLTSSAESSGTDEDDEIMATSGLDDSDEDGTLLNEGSFDTDASGSDLDTSGIDEDDAMEDIGEEDEENNLYSLGGDNKESLDEDSN
jgi:hypothetical protein